MVLLNVGMAPIVLPGVAAYFFFRLPFRFGPELSHLTPI